MIKEIKFIFLEVLALKEDFLNLIFRHNADTQIRQLANANSANPPAGGFAEFAF